MEEEGKALKEGYLPLCLENGQAFALAPEGSVKRRARAKTRPHNQQGKYKITDALSIQTLNNAANIIGGMGDSALAARLSSIMYGLTIRGELHETQQYKYYDTSDLIRSNASIESCGVSIIFTGEPVGNEDDTCLTARSAGMVAFVVSQFVEAHRGWKKSDPINPTILVDVDALAEDFVKDMEAGDARRSKKKRIKADLIQAIFGVGRVASIVKKKGRREPEVTILWEAYYVDEAVNLIRVDFSRRIAEQLLRSDKRDSKITFQSAYGLMNVDSGLEGEILSYLKQQSLFWSKKKNTGRERIPLRGLFNHLRARKLIDIAELKEQTRKEHSERFIYPVLRALKKFQQRPGVFYVDIQLEERVSEDEFKPFKKGWDGVKLAHCIDAEERRKYQASTRAKSAIREAPELFLKVSCLNLNMTPIDPAPHVVRLKQGELDLQESAQEQKTRQIAREEIARGLPVIADGVDQLQKRRRMHRA